MPQPRPSSNECTFIAYRRHAPLDDARPDRTSSSSSSSSSSPTPSLADAGGVLVAALEGAARERAERMSCAALVVVVRWPLSIGVDDVFYRVVFFDERDAVPRALVLGRHSEVDTPSLPGASLRHAVVLAWPPAPGEAPHTEVFDLNTEVGLGVVGGGAAAHLEGMGPMAFGLGAADVVVVPVAAHAAVAQGGARALLRSLAQERAPVRRWRDGAVDGGSLARVLAWHDESSRKAARAACADVARVDVRAAPVVLPQPVQRRPVRHRLDPDWQRRTVTRSAVLSTPARLVGTGDQGSLDDGGRALVVPTTWADLADGVLLGRYPRCAMHEAVDDDGISRVHALVVARRNRLFVVDTGSTNGTTLRIHGKATVGLDARRRVAMIEDADELWLHRRRCVVRIDDDIVRT